MELVCSLSKHSTSFKSQCISSPSTRGGGSETSGIPEVAGGTNQPARAGSPAPYAAPRRSAAGVPWNAGMNGDAGSVPLWGQDLGGCRLPGDGEGASRPRGPQSAGRSLYRKQSSLWQGVEMGLPPTPCLLFKGVRVESRTGPAEMPAQTTSLRNRPGLLWAGSIPETLQRAGVCGRGRGFTSRGVPGREVSSCVPARLRSQPPSPSQGVCWDYRAGLSQPPTKRSLLFGGSCGQGSRERLEWPGLGEASVLAALGLWGLRSLETWSIEMYWRPNQAARAEDRQPGANGGAD